MNKIYRFFLCLFFITNNLLSQNSPFENFVLSFWPEYDKNGVLVIITGEVKENQLPIKIEMPIPFDVDTILSLGHDIKLNDLSKINILKKKNGNLISEFYYNKEFQIEFYYNPFEKSKIRNFSYDFKINHFLDDYFIAIQKPLSSKNFVFSEFEYDTISDSHGLEYFRKKLYGLKVNENKTISFSYLNQTSNLTLEILEKSLNNFSNTESMNTANELSTIIQRYKLPTYEPYLLMLIIFFIIYILYYFSEKNKSSIKLNNNNFCSNCGKKLIKSFNYCSNCGVQIK